MELVFKITDDHLGGGEYPGVHQVSPVAATGVGELDMDSNDNPGDDAVTAVVAGHLADRLLSGLDPEEVCLLEKPGTYSVTVLSV